MSKIGQIERATQNRIIKLFQNELGYRYLGNWEEEPRTSNIEVDVLRQHLETQGYSESLISKTLLEVQRVAGDQTKSLYDANKEFYRLLRYGVKVRETAGESKQDVWLINWKEPEQNDFAIAEEVTVVGDHTKRPDVVIYVNGIALGVIELKRSKVDVAEGVRQNLLNQKKEYIERFFTTMQLVLAGNDSQGLRYGTIGTPEKYYLTWKQDSEIDNRLDRHLTQVCNKTRFLEIIHDFIVFDAGIKKLCRPNQYFGVRAAQPFVDRREGGIIWHTQGSGKSLTMVWLTKWIRENVDDARVLIITDRTALDEQIEKVFNGVDEEIYRTKSGADLITSLNETTPWLICSLIHKFGGKDNEDDKGDVSDFVKELKKSIPSDFKAKGNLFVFVDEAHRTQSGDLHEAMKDLLPSATFIGFTGTPLLKKDKKKSIEIFGGYIHTYKFDEAVSDGVVLDLRYEARDIDQKITSQSKIDQWFEAKTQGLTDLARAQLKKRWGTMRSVLSCQDRLEKIVADIMMDMATKDRLKSGHGNAMLVAASIYQACKYYELFAQAGMGGKCAIITSYKPSHRDIKDEESGEGYTEKLRQYSIYRKMLASWFDQPEDKAMQKIEDFEIAVKKKFVDEPGQMKLLIVVDKLLTGFDAPSATYLYVDKQMQDHGLFQAICRVNRLDTDSKEYGYIVDYKDLFKQLESSVGEYTSEAFEGYEKEDVKGLLQNRLTKAKERLEETREAVVALCEPVDPPKDQPAYFRYFSAKESGDFEQLKQNEGKRLALYKHVASFVRAYANLASEMHEAGFSAQEAEAIKAEVTHYEHLRDEVKKHSGDAIDLKSYEPAMRHLIDSYIRAEESEKISEFDDLSLIQLIVERGVDAVDALPDGIKSNEEAVAETIDNNVGKLMIDKKPINPKYYEKMSELLADLIKDRRKKAISYKEYLEKVVELAKQAENPTASKSYPALINSPARKALYDNLNDDESLAIAVDEAIKRGLKDDWRGHKRKTKGIRNEVEAVLVRPKPDASIQTGSDADNVKSDREGYTTSKTDELLKMILELAENQDEY